MINIRKQIAKIEIGWQGFCNLLRRSQSEIVHQLDKIGTAAPHQSGIVFPLLSNRRLTAPFPIMTRINKHLIRQLQQLLQRVIKITWIPILKISAPTASNQQGIATQQMAISDAIGHMLRGVTRGGDNLNPNPTELQSISTIKKLISVADPWRGRHEQSASCAASKLTSCSDVIDMQMGLQTKAQAELQLLQKLKIPDSELSTGSTRASPVRRSAKR
jgi:hypothetical protein